MSVQYFQQEIWAKDIQDDLEEQGKLVKDCTREYEGECKYAKKVRILGVGDPTIGNYVGKDIVIEEMEDKAQILDIDVQKYFAFEVKDVDEAQSKPGLAQKFREKAVKRLALTREKFIGKLVAGKAQSSQDEEDKTDVYKDGAETVITATNKTKAAIRAALTSAIVTLRENNFDGSGVVEISPADYALFKDELIDIKTNNDELIKRGVVGMYDNYEVKSTNNIYADDNYTYAIVRTKYAVAFAGQINEVEAGRMEKRFSDYIRGLDVFGAKIIAQDQLVVVKIPKLATA